MMQRGSMVLNVNVGLSLVFLAALLHATLAIGLGPIHLNEHADVKGVNTDTPRISLANQKAERRKASGKAVLDSLTDLIQRKGKIGLSKTEAEYVKEVKAIWSGNVIPGIQATITDAKEEVEMLFNAILDCQDEIDFEHEKYDDDKDLITTELEELKDCVEKESELYTEKDEVCGDFVTFREELQLPAKLPPMEAGNQDKYEYLQKMNDYFCSTHETYEDKKRECDDVTKNYTDTVNNCTKLQGDFEQAVCSLKHKGELMCHRYTLCYTQAVKNYEDRLKPLKALEGQLKSDAETAEKIECLWESFDLDEPLCQVNETKVDECWTLKNDDSNLTIVTPLPPDPKSCGDDERFDMTPCTETFLDTQYGSLDVVKAVSDRMKEACAECTEIEFTTTTTTTTEPTTTTRTTTKTTRTTTTTTTPRSRACPAGCSVPECHHGSPYNDGLEMSGGDDIGPCPRTCSSLHGNSRYCGFGPNYEDEGSISCVVCVAPPTCPLECMEPTCAEGSSGNGGVALTNGMCMERCSKYFGDFRYCGKGDDYSGSDSVDCSGCQSEAPSPPTTTTTTTTVDPNACNPQCSAPACSDGPTGLGGEPLVGGTCHSRCSDVSDGGRFCGNGEHFEQIGSIDCEPCAPPTTTTTTFVTPTTCSPECKADKCHAGGSHNGGLPLEGDHCTAMCSQKHSGIRYCGPASVRDYTDGDAVNCVPCKTEEETTTTTKKTTSSTSSTTTSTTTKKPAPTTTTTTTVAAKICPSSCKAPTCQEGSANNGGLALEGDHCTAMCSQEYGGVRYCGKASKAPYTTGDAIDCSACKETPTVPTREKCPDDCKSPACQEGSSSNGGLALQGDRCTARCSIKFGGIRYCGSASSDAYKGGDSLSCAMCKQTASLAVGGISTGMLVTCALKPADSQPLCWGSPTAGVREAPQRGPYKQLSLADSYGCGLQTNGGTIDCWSTQDPFNILQNLEFTNQQAPFTFVTTGEQTACALRPSGDVKCWGANNNGLREPPSVQFSAISMSKYHACGVRLSDGEAQCWGNQHDGTGKTSPPSPSRGPYKAIAVGFMNSCAIRDADSKVVCWGSNEDGRGTPPDATFKHIDAASHYYCGIKSDDSIACWGRDDDGRVSSPPSGSFVDLSVGPSHSCAMTGDGKAKCWGSSTYSATTPPQAFLLEEGASSP